MKITNKADYALHAMLYVAAVNGGHAASINEISEAEAIPREYLAKVLKDLVRLNLLKSQRGIFGGYYLAKPRRDYTFLEILEAIDGPLNPAICTKPEAKRSGHRKGKCASFSFFDDLKKKLSRDLAAINLEDIPYDKFYAFAKNGGKGR
jgi:Rrf2 family protein